MSGLAVSVLLCLQFSIFSLTRSRIEDDTNVMLVMLLAECGKLCFSLAMTVRGGSAPRLFQTPAVMLVPCAAFAAMNVISYWVVQHSSAAVYAMTMQLKLPITMLLSTCTVRAKYSVPQVFAVLCICISSSNVLCSKLSSAGVTESLAMYGMLVEVLCSATINIYMQHIFNSSVDTMWVRNVELSCGSILLYVCACLQLRVDLSCSFVGGMFALCAMLGGILVAFSIVYCGAAMKTLSSSAAILVISVTENILSRSLPSMQIASFYVIGVMSVMLYAFSQLRPTALAGPLRDDTSEHAPFITREREDEATAQPADDEGKGLQAKV